MILELEIESSRWKRGAEGTHIEGLSQLPDTQKPKHSSGSRGGPLLVYYLLLLLLHVCAGPATASCWIPSIENIEMLEGTCIR